MNGAEPLRAFCCYTCMFVQHLINGSTFLSVPLCATHGTDLNFVCSQSTCARLAYTESANKDGLRVIFFVMYLFFSCFWPGFVYKSCHVKLLCAGRVKISPWQCLSSARLGGSEPCCRSCRDTRIGFI